MANKNDNKAAAKAAEKKVITTEVSEENIKDAIENQNKVGKMFEQAIAELDDEKDKKKKDALKAAAVMAEYTIKRKVLELRRRREEAKVTKGTVTEVGKAIDDLANDRITPRQWADKLEEIAKKESDGFNDVAKEHQKNVQELRDNFPDKYCPQWEYDSWNRGGSRPSWY